VCGRYSAAVTPEQLRLRFAITEFAELRLPPQLPRYNVAPTQVGPIVVETKRGRLLPGATWGFRPTWTTGYRPAPINARGERAATSGLFRASLERHRCLVPATGFYEWQALPGTKAKIPHHVRLKDDPILAFAGIYTPPTREQPATYAILTTEANDLLRPIHARMPVILGADDEAWWPDRDAGAPDVLHLLRPFDQARIEAYPVSARVGSPNNDDASLLEPAGAA
jgi:putative SOS response-associated peptidase YedK